MIMTINVYMEKNAAITRFKFLSSIIASLLSHQVLFGPTRVALVDRNRANNDNCLETFFHGAGGQGPQAPS